MIVLNYLTKQTKHTKKQMTLNSGWINTKDELPNPDKDWCILIWLPKSRENSDGPGIPVICHYLEVEEGYLFTRVNKGYFSPKGKVSYRPVEDFEFWKRCDFLLRTAPPCPGRSKNELLDTIQFSSSSLEAQGKVLEEIREEVAKEVQEVVELPKEVQKTLGGDLLQKIKKELQEEEAKVLPSSKKVQLFKNDEVIMWNSLLAEHKRVIVQFTATWCGPCKRISPYFEKLSSEFDTIKFIKVDVDECQIITERYGVSTMPTFIAFVDGQKVDHIMGAHEETLRQFVENHR